MKKNVIVCHGGGPTAVINASLAGVIREARRSPEVGKIYAALNGIEGFLENRFVDFTGISDGEIEKLSRTPSSAIGSCRYKLKEEDYPRVMEMLKFRETGYFFYNGGNDSMDTCEKISSLTGDIRVIGVPKTIDNDLAGTHHSPGYGSAAYFAAMTTMELGLDIRALPIHVSVIEFMGRNAGWITGASALARKREGDAPHLIYLPERPFLKEQFLEDVREARKRYGGVVVAVSEGLADETGQPIVSPGHASQVDSFGHALPGNNSHLLADMITRELGIRARSEKPGLPGRASYSLCSERDRQETFSCGEFAMRSALEGVTGMMAGYRRIPGDSYRIENILIPLGDVANVEKVVPSDWINERGNDVTRDFLDYAGPIMGEELPDFFRLDEFGGKK